MEYVQEEIRKIVQKTLYSSIVLYFLLVIGWTAKAVLETVGIRNPIQLPIVGPSLKILTFGVTIISTLQDISEFLALIGLLLVILLGALYYQEKQEKEVWRR